MADIINPFKETNKNNWAKKAENRLSDSKEGKKKIDIPISKKKPKNIERVAKSFKIYSGKIPRDFDKRVNKMQVHFDDLDFNKNYVDSGKYLMFLMNFAEKFGVYEMYKEINESGEIDIKLDDVKKYFKEKK